MALRFDKVVFGEGVDITRDTFLSFWVVDKKHKVLGAKRYSPPFLVAQKDYAWCGFTYWLGVSLADHAVNVLADKAVLRRLTLMPWTPRTASS